MFPVFNENLKFTSLISRMGKFYSITVVFDTGYRGHHDGALGQELVPAPKQIPRRDGDDEKRRGHHGRAGRVGKLVDRKGRERHVGKTLHLETGVFRVEDLAHRMLHPGVGHQNPHEIGRAHV